jgi:hypothetical protein
VHQTANLVSGRNSQFSVERNLETPTEGGGVDVVSGY